MANTSGFNWTCPLLPTDFVWKEGRLWGPSLHLCGISASPVHSWSCYVVATLGYSVSKNHRHPQHLHRSAVETPQASPTLPGSVRGAHDASWNQLWSQGRVNSMFPKPVGLWCTCRPSVQCRWSSGTILLCLSLTKSLPAFCRKTYSSSGLEKEPKEKDLIWTLATVAAIIRNTLLSLGPNSYNANICGSKVPEASG